MGSIPNFFQISYSRSSNRRKSKAIDSFGKMANILEDKVRNFHSLHSDLSSSNAEILEITHRVCERNIKIVENDFCHCLGLILQHPYNKNSILSISFQVYLITREQLSQTRADFSSKFPVQESDDTVNHYSYLQKYFTEKVSRNEHL